MPVQGQDLPQPDSVKPSLYATGFEVADALALDSQGNLFVANYRGLGHIGRISADGTAAVFCSLPELAPLEGVTPRAGGIRIDSEGRLIIADSAGGRLLRISADGQQAEILADRCEGHRFGAVQNVAIDLAGNIYFSTIDPLDTEVPLGGIYSYSINTSKVTKLDAGLAAPTGIGVTPDQANLCVSETARRQIWIYPLKNENALGEGRRLFRFADDASLNENAAPHGLVFDTNGRLYVAAGDSGQFLIIDTTEGRLLRTYSAGGVAATDCHFHDGYIYAAVASKEAVFRLRLGVAGFPYNGSQ